MRRAIHDHPEMSERFMAFLLLRNSQIEADLVDQLFNSSEKRLARLLVMLAQVGQEAELRTVAVPISQEVMAARIGTTRSRINYFMNKFRKLGLIEYNGDLKSWAGMLDTFVDGLPTKADVGNKSVAEPIGAGECELERREPTAISVKKLIRCFSMEVLRADLNGDGVQDIRSAAQALFIVSE